MPSKVVGTCTRRWWPKELLYLATHNNISTFGKTKWFVMQMLSPGNSRDILEVSKEMAQVRCIHFSLSNRIFFPPPVFPPYWSCSFLPPSLSLQLYYHQCSDSHSAIDILHTAIHSHMSAADEEAIHLLVELYLSTKNYKGAFEVCRM